MKTLLKFSLISLIVLVSCSKKEDDANPTTDNNSNYYVSFNFKGDEYSLTDTIVNPGSIAKVLAGSMTDDLDTGLRFHIDLIFDKDISQMDIKSSLLLDGVSFISDSTKAHIRMMIHSQEIGNWDTKFSETNSCTITSVKKAWEKDTLSQRIVSYALSGNFNVTLQNPKSTGTPEAVIGKFHMPLYQYLRN